MSGALREVLRDRSVDVPAVHFDADMLMAEARSRVRRRRMINAVGVVALTAAVVGGVVLRPDVGQEPEPVAPPARFAEPRLIVAVGDVVHYGDETFDTGLVVSRGLARTDHGLVLVQGSDVWFSDGTRSEKIGRVVDEPHPKLVTSDAEGTLVAWVGPADDGDGDVVVYDSRRREVVARLDNGVITIGSFPEVIAIEDDVVYWKRLAGRIDEPLWRYDVSTGEQTEVEIPTMAAVADVAGGAVAYWTPEPSPGRLIIRWPGSRSRIATLSWLADLSPDGSFVVALRKSGEAVFDTRTGDDVPLHPPKGFGAHQLMGWVDNRTLAFWDHDRGAVLTCQAPSGDCTVALRDLGDGSPRVRPQFPGYAPG